MMSKVHGEEKMIKWVFAAILILGLTVAVIIVWGLNPPTWITALLSWTIIYIILIIPIRDYEKRRGIL